MPASWLQPVLSKRQEYVHCTAMAVECASQDVIIHWLFDDVIYGTRYIASAEHCSLLDLWAVEIAQLTATLLLSSSSSTPLS